MMLFTINIVLNIFMLIISKEIFKTRINPVYLYNVVWLTSFLIYSSNLVYLNKLNSMTILIIIIMNTCFSTSMILGWKNRKASSYKKYDYDNARLKKTLKFYIVILSLIGGISVVLKITKLVSMFGLNLLSYTNYIYSARLHDGLELGIPYIGACLTLALVLSGFYINKFNFNLFIAIPIALSGLDALTSGGRRELIYSAMLFIYPIMMNFTQENSFINMLRKNRFMVFVFLGSIILFNEITSNRSSYIEVNSLMSPSMVKLVSISPAFYKNYIYFSGPLGVLNEFLKNPEFKFGDNTFLFFRSILNKLSFDIEVNKYQSPYYIPVEINVGTYIRELILDFTFIGAIIVIIIVGFLVGYFYKKMRLTTSIQSTLISSILMYIITFSFFVWEFRTAGIWILAIIGIPLTLHIEKITRKKAN